MYYHLDWRANNSESYSNTLDSPVTRVPWTMGMIYNGKVSQPLKCNLNPKRGAKLRDVYLVDIPLFSVRLIKVLEDCGVDNIQLFDAELISPDGDVFKNYKAVNIIGLVECADMEKSDFLPGTKPPMVSFSKVVIDKSKAKDLDFFRMQENSLYIVLSQRIKEAIEKEGLEGFTLLPFETS